ncbi:MAG: hypothetical protein ACI87E_002257 [Mariniblastus sp.]|jgi:hypothetical protein
MFRVSARAAWNLNVKVFKIVFDFRICACEPLVKSKSKVWPILGVFIVHLRTFMVKLKRLVHRLVNPSRQFEFSALPLLLLFRRSLFDWYETTGKLPQAIS